MTPVTGVINGRKDDLGRTDKTTLEICRRFERLAERLPAVLAGTEVASPVVPSPARSLRRARQLSAEQVVAAYVAGADMKDLAATWQVHRGTVAKHVKAAGVPLRRQGFPAERLDEAIRLYGEGWSCRRLGERFGCDTETVRTALKQAGVPRGDGWERR